MTDIGLEAAIDSVAERTADNCTHHRKSGLSAKSNKAAVAARDERMSASRDYAFKRRLRAPSNNSDMPNITTDAGATSGSIVEACIRICGAYNCRHTTAKLVTSIVTPCVTLIYKKAPFSVHFYKWSGRQDPRILAWCPPHILGTRCSISKRSVSSLQHRRLLDDQLALVALQERPSEHLAKGGTSNARKDMITPKSSILSTPNVPMFTLTCWQASNFSSVKMCLENLGR